MTGKKITVILADDHPLIREGIRHILEKSKDIQVVGEAANGKEALELVEQLSPDLLLLDLEMPVLDGFQVLEILINQKSSVRVLFLTAMNDPIYIQEALGHGAWGFFCKEEAPGKLVQAVLKARSTALAI